MINTGVKKQPRKHAELGFLGTILVGREKSKTKTQKQYKNQKKPRSITAAGGRSRCGAGAAGLGGHLGSPQGSRQRPQSGAAWAQLRRWSERKKGSGAFCSCELRKKNKNRNTCSLLKPYKLYQQNVLRSLKGFEVTSFISLFTPKLSLKLNTPRNKA